MTIANDADGDDAQFLETPLAPKLRQLPEQRGPSVPGRAQRGLRVLLVTSEAPPIVSGISRCVDRLAVGLRERGHHVDVISSVQIPRMTVGELRLSSLLLRWPGFARRLADYDVINLHGPAPTISDVVLLMRRISSGHSTPMVYTHHSALEIRGMERASGIYDRMHNALARYADITVTTSEHYAELHRTSSRADVRVVPWGVDVRSRAQRRRRPGMPLRVLFVGQMRSYKGVEWLLEAVAGQPGIELTLVGAGRHLPRYERRAARLGSTNVRFLGQVPDQRLHDEYDRSDVVVLPSVTRAEAYGLVVLEGMAAGCVPVVSDLPGVRDLVSNTGETVPARDAAALRATLRGLADDPARVRRLGELARRRAEGRSWELAIDGYERALLDAVEAAPAGARGTEAAGGSGADGVPSSGRRRPVRWSPAPRRAARPYSGTREPQERPA